MRLESTFGSTRALVREGRDIRLPLPLSEVAKFRNSSGPRRTGRSKLRGSPIVFPGDQTAHAILILREPPSWEPDLRYEPS